MSIDTVKNEIVKAPLFRRIGVAITDIFFLFFSFLILNTYVLSPIVVATTSYTQITEEYKKEIDLEFLRDDINDLIKRCIEGTQRTKNIFLDLLYLEISPICPWVNEVPHDATQFFIPLACAEITSK